MDSCHLFTHILQGCFTGSVYQNQNLTKCEPCDKIPGMYAWWRPDMEALSVLLALCEENHTVTFRLTLQKASNVELWCLLSCSSGQASEQIVELQLIWDASTFYWWHHYDFISLVHSHIRSFLRALKKLEKEKRMIELICYGSGWNFKTSFMSSLMNFLSELLRYDFIHHLWVYPSWVWIWNQFDSRHPSIPPS